MTERAEPYERAANDIRRLAETHDTAMDAFARRVADGLHGPAGTRIVDEARRHRDTMHQAFGRAWDDVAALIRQHGGHHGVGPDLARSPLGGYLSGANRGVNEDALYMAMREATDRGSALCDAGRRLAGILSRVGANPSPGHQVQEIGDWLLGQDDELRRRLEQALAAETVLDDAFAGLASGVPPLTDRLSRLTESQNMQLAQLHQISKLPPSRERAQRTAAWWKSLSQADQSQFVTLFPQTIGALDGIPAMARDRGNRSALTSKIAHLRHLSRTMDPWIYDLDPQNRRPHPDKVEVDRQLKLLEQFQEDLGGDPKDVPPKEERGRGTPPPKYLLLFDYEDIRRVAVSFDNPDTAENVITFVPGFGTTDSLIEDNLQRAKDTWAAADDASARSTASIYWLNYDAPTNFDVITEQNATECAPSLGGFLRGLDAAHEKGKAHTTVLGHSYGSLAVGRTAVEYPEVANELIFVGSPGVGVHNARELGVPPGNVWAGTADHDPVPLAPPGVDLLIPHEWMREAIIGRARFGTRPTYPTFGGQTFAVQPGPASLGVLPNIGAHSVYWDQGSASLRNIARIAVGKPPAFKE